MEKQFKKDNDKMTRKQFLGRASLAFAGITILPSHVISGSGYRAPSDKLNIAGDALKYWFDYYVANNHLSI